MRSFETKIRYKKDWVRIHIYFCNLQDNIVSEEKFLKFFYSDYFEKHFQERGKNFVIIHFLSTQRQIFCSVNKSMGHITLKRFFFFWLTVIFSVWQMVFSEDKHFFEEFQGRTFKNLDEVSYERDFDLWHLKFNSLPHKILKLLEII